MNIAGARLAGMSIALVLAAGGCGGEGPSAGRPPTDRATQTPSTPAAGTPTPTSPTREELVADPRSLLSSALVLRDGRRLTVATLWSCNQNESGCPRRAAVVRSDDGFATAEYFSGGMRSARAHAQLGRPTGAGRLSSCAFVAGGVALCDRARDGESIGWTRDGGATWERGAIHLAPLLSWPVPSLHGGVLAVAGGGDGATLFPFERVVVSRDTGATWRTYDVERPDGVMPYSSGFTVDSQGRLLALLDNWSDDRRGKPSERPHGLYASNGTDWSSYRPLTSRFRPALTAPDHGWSPLVSLSSSSAPDPVIWVTTWDQRLYVSVDDGASFREIRAR